MNLDDLINQEDIEYEESIVRNNTDEDVWVRYYESKRDGSVENKVFILNRAIEAGVNSLTLYKAYLEILLENGYESDYVFEKCLRSFPKEISIWLLYLNYLIENKIYQVSMIRKCFNRSLKNVSIEEHKLIWPLYLKFANEIGGKTAISIYHRYLKYVNVESVSDEEEMNILDYIEILIEFGDSPYYLYQEIFKNKHKYDLPKSMIQIYYDYIDLLIKDKVDQNMIEKLIFDLCDEYPDQIGTLYLKLIEYHKTSSNVSKIRSCYEQSLEKVNNLGDFVRLFDDYSQFEEEQLDETSTEEQLDKYERLLDSREILINDMYLRQNINNIDTWFTRFEILKSNLNALIKSFASSLKSINPLKVIGTHKLSDIWIKYAEIYSSNADYKTANLIYSKSVQSQFKSPDELAELYINWCELLLSSDAFEETEAIELLDNVLFKEFDEDVNYGDKSMPVQKRIIKSMKLWSFYIDLLKSFLELDQEKYIKKISNSYEQLIKLKIATPRIILDYSELYTNQEQALFILESGLKLFNDPDVKFEIWNIYISKFIKTVHNDERVRDMFEKAIEEIPDYLVKPILLMYSNFEQENGYFLNSIKILVKYLTTPSKAKPKHQKQLNLSKFEVYRITLSKLSQIQDVDQFRKIAQLGMNDDVLSIDQVSIICKEFVKFETNLGQFNRVRELFKFTLELVEDQSLWTMWEKIEIDHGNEYSFKEMIRFKRKLQSTKRVVNNVDKSIGFVKSSIHERENPDEIELEM